MHPDARHRAYERALRIVTGETEATIPAARNPEEAFSWALAESPFNFQIDWKVTGISVLEELANRFAPAHDIEITVDHGTARLWLDDAEHEQSAIIPDIEGQNPARVAATLLSLLPRGGRVYRIRRFADGDAEDLVLLPDEQVEDLREVLGVLFDEVLEVVSPIGRP